MLWGDSQEVVEVEVEVEIIPAGKGSFLSLAAESYRDCPALVS